MPDLIEGHVLDSAERVRRLRSIKLAEVALARYRLRDARLQFLRDGRTQVFKVVSPSKGRFVLRMYRLPGFVSDATGDAVTTMRSPEALRSQLLWLRALGRETELLVPEPVPMADGSLLDYVSFDDLSWRRQLLRRVWTRYRHVYHPRHPGRYCVLLRWVPGEHKGKDLNPGNMTRFGAYVAILHNHAQRYRVPEETVFSRLDWEWVFGEEAPLWSEGKAHYSPSEMEVFRAAARRVREDLHRLGKGRDVFGLIHRDLNLDNVVFDGKRVGVIDFDVCGWGYYLFDLSVVRRSLVQCCGDRFQPLWAAFFRGYRRKRPLPEGSRRYLTTFGVMQRVAAINRQLELLRLGDAVGGDASPPDWPYDLTNWLEER